MHPRQHRRLKVLGIERQLTIIVASCPNTLETKTDRERGDSWLPRCLQTRLLRRLKSVMALVEDKYFKQMKSLRFNSCSMLRMSLATVYPFQTMPFYY
jgi:hypothetical protein